MYLIKYLMFYILWRLTGNPILAILILVALYVIVDQRYIGLLPNISKPFRRQSRMAQLRRQLQLNPHDAPAKYDLAQSYIEKHQYRTALKLLEELPESMKTSPDAMYDRGLCLLHAEDAKVGQTMILQALEAQPRLRYGEPYLQLASFVADSQPNEAMQYLDEFRRQNASSCEAEYRAALLHIRLGDKAKARAALVRCLDTYRALPRFRKRTERRFALRARLRLLGL